MTVPEYLRDFAIVANSLDIPNACNHLRDIADRYEQMERALARLDATALIHFGCPDCARCRAQDALAAARKEMGDCEAGYFRKSTKEEEERTGRPWRIQKEKP